MAGRESLYEDEIYDFLETLNITADFNTLAGWNFSNESYSPPEANSISKLYSCGSPRLGVELDLDSDMYSPIHGYLSLIVCILGAVFNGVNILVLSHKTLRGNPINLLLTGIALADCLVMLEYIPFTTHMYLLKERNKEEQFSMGWALFLLFHINFSIMIHTVSIWLTLCLAIWRFIMIRFPTTAIRICTLERCKLILVAGFVVPLFLTIPSYYSHEIQEQHERQDHSCLTYYSVEISKFAGSDVLFSINMWLYGIILKLLPCLVLVVFTSGLIHAMYKADSASVRLRRGSRDKMRQRQTDRTTNLLLVILILFLMAELPIGIMGMLSAILGEQFLISCYNPLGELMDMMVLTNSSINFVLYCLMSTQFRTTLVSYIRPEGTRGCYQPHLVNHSKPSKPEALGLTDRGQGSELVSIRSGLVSGTAVDRDTSATNLNGETNV